MKTDWKFVKQLLGQRILQLHYVKNEGMYFIKLFDGVVQVAECTININLNKDDAEEFETTYIPLANKVLSERLTSFSAPLMSPIKPDIPSATLVSHDWCDKTTWYTKSIRVLSEALSSQDGLTFNSSHTHWIDLVNGKVYDEDTITGKNVVVKVDGVVVTTGFTINYVQGKVVFEQAVNGVVTVDYNYATESTFILAPLPGKILIIEHSEIQFCKNVTVNGIIDFEIWAWHPDQVNNPGVKVLVNRLTYKNEKDIINSCNLGQGFIPRFGNLADDVIVFPFNYITTKPLRYSQGAEVRIRIRGDQPFPGSFTTVTFYILSKNE